MNADEKVVAWALDKFKEEYRYRASNDYFFKYKHLMECTTTTAIPVRFGWECSCYSEYTRDDGFETAFTISCGCGVEEFFRYSASPWSLPEILRELDEYDDTQECPYWEEED